MMSGTLLIVARNHAIEFKYVLQYDQIKTDVAIAIDCKSTDKTIKNGLG